MRPWITTNLAYHLDWGDECNVLHIRLHRMNPEILTEATPVVSRGLYTTGGYFRAFAPRLPPHQGGRP